MRPAYLQTTSLAVQVSCGVHVGSLFTKHVRSYRSLLGLAIRGTTAVVGNSSPYRLRPCHACACSVFVTDFHGNDARKPVTEGMHSVG